MQAFFSKKPQKVKFSPPTAGYVSHSLDFGGFFAFFGRVT